MATVAQNSIRNNQLEKEIVLREHNRKLKDDNELLRNIIKNNELKILKLDNENKILNGRINNLEMKLLNTKNSFQI